MKWSIQLSNALLFLHINGVIHSKSRSPSKLWLIIFQGDLRCANILVIILFYFHINVKSNYLISNQLTHDWNVKIAGIKGSTPSIHWFQFEFNTFVFQTLVWVFGRKMEWWRRNQSTPTSAKECIMSVERNLILHSLHNLISSKS